MSPNLERAWDVTQRYLGLDIMGKKVRTPYYQNLVGICFAEIMREVDVPDQLISRIFEYDRANKKPYGWFQGKGTPEQITSATLALAQVQDMDLSRASPEAIREFMKFVGLGVDCSGFAYYVLSSACGEENLGEVLDWKSGGVRSVRRAGAFAYAGLASGIIPSVAIRPLDLFLERNDQGKYSHVAMVLESDTGLALAHSNVGGGGVNVTEILLHDGQIEFEYSPPFEPPWEQLLAVGLLELRRLKFDKIAVHG